MKDSPESFDIRVASSPSQTSPSTDTKGGAFQVTLLCGSEPISGFLIEAPAEGDAANLASMIILGMAFPSCLLGAVEGGGSRAVSERGESHSERRK